MPINIAIDGPAGAGKSTIARNLAKKMNILYLSTGELYRSIGYACLKYNIDATNKTLIEYLPYTLNLRYEIKDNNGKCLAVFLNNEEITPFLHQKKVSEITPIIAAYPNIREHFRKIQRDIAKNNDVVMEGRDICTVVLPNAQFKYFIDANVVVRAVRRYKIEPTKQNVKSYYKYLQGVKERDFKDSHRENSPLKQSEDATYIDTTHKAIEEVVNKIYQDVTITKSVQNDKNLEDNF